MNSSLMKNTAPPTSPPVLLKDKESDVYELGETVNVTCVSPPAKPLPILSWLINGEPAVPEYILRPENVTTSQLVFPIQVHHLMYGEPRLQITCEASFNYNYSSYG